MGGVGDEVALGLEGRFETAEQIIEGLAQLGQLVGWPVQSEAAVQVGGGYLARGRVHGAQGAQEPACDPPGEPHGDDRGDHRDDQWSHVEVLADDGVVGAGAAVDVG